MIVPINSWRYIKRNFEIIKADYNWLNIFFCFILIPIGLALVISSFSKLSDIVSMFNATIIFFSITVGFLINALVFILMDKKLGIKEDQTDKEFLKKIEKLKEDLGYNILNLIIISIIFIILVLFYNFYPHPALPIKGFIFNPVEFVILFLFIESIIFLLNIFRKLGSYIETKYA